MKPKITIGIPFYNNERTLELSIRSVISQTFKDWELILINDGSSDTSIQVANKMVNLFPEIRLIDDEINQGLIYRLNQIIDLANGEYIARMDADDVMLPERLEKQFNEFVKNPKLDVVATAAYTIDEKNNPIGIRDTFHIDLKSNKEILKKSLLIHPSILVKKEWYKLNKYDSKYVRAEDYELWCRTYSYTNFYRITEPLFLYREGNISVKNYVSSMKTIRIIYRNYSKGVLSSNELVFEIFKTYLKVLMYRFMGVFKLQYLITSKRNNSLSKNQIILVNDAIKELNRII